MTHHPDPESEQLVITGEASQVASMVLDMAAYCGGAGLDGFTAWIQLRYPDAKPEHIKANMNGLVKKLSRTLFTAT